MLLKDGMGAEDKKKSIFWGFTENSNFLGEGVTKKTVNRGDCLKSEDWTVSRFKRRLGNKEGVIFLRGVDTLMHRMDIKNRNTNINETNN